MPPPAAIPNAKTQYERDPRPSQAPLCEHTSIIGITTELPLVPLSAAYVPPKRRPALDALSIWLQSLNSLWRA
jgi:hypothetical protein